MTVEELNDSQISTNEELYKDSGGYYIDDIYIPPPPPPPKYSGDETGTRLVITYIENINFKSYAGNQKLGPFHKSFTSIVGPNGSGKSNVIDSMLFVFGFRATKLRLKKLTYLIHNSDQHPNLDFCQVIVYFALIEDKGGEDFAIVPESEFCVSRTVHRNNSSYYKIGEKIVQFKDVSSLLQSHGIDLRYNRFLILQGEVEQIALMKPKAENENDVGMLEFLEDIIGSNRLKEPLIKIQEKVEAKNVLRSEKLNRVRTVQKEKESLEKAKDEAIAFLETENQLTLEKNKFFQLCRAEAAQGKDEAKKNFDKANEIYKEAMSKTEELKDKRKELEDEMKKIQDEYNIIVKNAEQYNESFKDIERKDVQLRDKIKHTKAKGKRLVQDLEKENKILDELNTLPSKYKQDIQALETSKENLEEEKKLADAQLSTVMDEIKNITKSFQEEKDEHEKKLLPLQLEVNEAKSKLELSQSELELYLSKERTEKSKLEQLQMKFDKNDEDFKQKINTLKEFEKRMPESLKKVQELEILINNLKQKKSALDEEFKISIRRSDDIRSSLNSTASRNKVLSALMEQKRNGALNGFYGRLGDLGAIDKKYDVAISTACGPLDNIVTETMEDAIKCSNFLKVNNIGSATFIALDKMTRFESASNRKISTPENVPRLFDLIRVNDKRVLPAFYYAIRDTLVADNLNQATRIGLGTAQRWRVVTLEGELIEMSGAMSGGGRPSKDRMGSSVATCDVTEEDLKRAEENTRSLQMKIGEILVKLDSTVVDCERLRSDLEIMKKNQPKYEMDVKSSEISQKELKKLINDQALVVKSVAPDENKIKSLENNVEKFQNIYEEIAEKAKKIETKVEDLNNKIKSIVEEKVGTAKKKVDSLKRQLNDVTSAITKANVGIKTNERNITKCESKIAQTEKEIEECQLLIEKSKEEMKELEKQGKDIASKYQQETTKKEEFEQKLKKLQNDIIKIKNDETKINSENLDAKHELDVQEGLFKIEEAKFNNWQNKINELELHQIEGKAEIGSLPNLSSEELSKFTTKSVAIEIDSIEKLLKTMKPNMTSIQEYKKKEQIWLERVKELGEITSERDKYKEQYEKLKAQRLKEFKEGFLIITRKLKEMYRTITLGGDAELEWSDSLDPFSEGINFAVRPNKKSWKRISNLSGGEKTLSSLSLIFALHYYKPSPLYVMDEIDAALDFKNVSIVANYIKQRTRNTQFIIISLRYNMYELADRLVGIYKTYNCTKSITVNPDGNCLSSA